MQPFNLSKLQTNERQAVEALMEALRRDLDARLLLVALFGSKARGNDLPEADLDILLITDGEPHDMERRISVVTSGLDVEHNVLFNTIIFSKERWEDFAKRRAAFWQNAQRDGIVLLRSPRISEPLVNPKTDAEHRPAQHRPEVEAYLQSAWSALHAAESQFATTQDYPVVANRTYYAIFYAANALLAQEGLQRSKHTTVMALFREKYVRTGLFEPSYIRDYVEVMKRRHVSDYDLHLTANADYVRVSIESAQRFTSRVERYLRETGFLE
jgi:uncharacterized protein (UPF0332 family)/predicted nucleotidyltransferase